MNDLTAKIKVIAQASVTVLTLVMAVLITVADQIGELVPGSTGENIATWLVRIVAWIAGAVSIIRRVSPVDEAERGILPT